MSRRPPLSLDDHVVSVRARLAASAVSRPGPDSVTWKVNRELIVIAGWGRAILLQFAHPLVAAGVAEHSTFRGNVLAPVQRLVSTVRAMLALTFGSEEEAIRAAAAINHIHDRVFGRLAAATGEFAAGTPYSAHQSELLQWVHATLLESVMLAYEVLVGPLTPGERDRYCEEAAVVEPLLDMPAGTLPRRETELRDYMRRMVNGGGLAVGDAARTLAAGVLSPGIAPLLWPAFRPVRLLTIGLLPPPIRTGYGFRWTAADENALVRWALAMRLLNRAAPVSVREWPAAFGSTSRPPRDDARV